MNTRETRESRESAETRRTEDATTRALEETADRAREALAEHIAKLGHRAGHAADVVDETEHVTRASGPILPLVAGAALVLTAGALVRGAVRTIGRAAVGAAAGVAAGVVMTQVHELWARAENKLGGAPRERDELAPIHEEKPATVRAAAAIVGPIAPEREAHAGTVAHLVMSGTTGALYSLLAPAVPRFGIGRGLAYGTAVWLVADELMVPMLRLSRPPWEHAAKTHIRALLAHLVYGAVLDAGVRGVRRLTRAL
jgi:uncharacterized membrane protein YagU involved in acid resistance